MGALACPDVNLERGATRDRDPFDGLQDVAITSSGLGLTDGNYKCNLTSCSRTETVTCPSSSDHPLPDTHALG